MFKYFNKLSLLIKDVRNTVENMADDSEKFEKFMKWFNA